MRAPLAIALLLLALLPLPHLPQAAAQGPSGPADPWVITGTETCTDRLVVDRNITIEAGGVLTLQGCTLVMKSFPYVANHFAPVDQGLTLRIKPGGILVMQAAPGQPAQIVRDDPRYGFTIKSQGSFFSNGLPDTWNRISGLEGAHEANLILGGMQVASATLSYTKFDGNYGPVYVTSKGHLAGHHLDFAMGGGIAGVRARDITVDNLTMVTGNAGIFTSLSNLTVSDCSITGGRKSIYVSNSNATIRRCAFSLGPFEGVGLYALDSHVDVTDTSINYSQVGMQMLVKGKPGALPNHLFLERVNFTGYTDNATSSIEVQQTDLKVHGSHLWSRGVMVHAVESAIDIRDSRMEGNASLFINPRSLLVQGNQGPDPSFEVLRITRTRVLNGDSRPMKDMLVGLPGTTGRTNADGIADLMWVWFKGTESSGLDEKAKTTLTVTDPATNRTASYSELANAAAVQVTYPPPSDGFPLRNVLLVSVLGLAVLAAVFWLWRSPAKKA